LAIRVKAGKPAVDRAREALLLTALAPGNNTIRNQLSTASTPAHNLTI
jgi:hypothetical protein